MEYIRKTINSRELESIFDLPDNLRNKRVEVIVLPIDDNVNSKKTIKSLGGNLHRYADPTLIPMENDVWSVAAGKKHENS